MSKLAVTVIDVGWGDSILIESEDDSGTYYALVDSNDSTFDRSSYLFLKRFFERVQIDTSRPNHTFEFILLTHSHADHASGLPRIIREFGARRFLHPLSNPHPLLAQILRYQRHPRTRLLQTQAIDSGNDLNSISFGKVLLDVLWPPPGHVDLDENNNSVVLTLTLDNVSFVLSGDATADVWPQIVPALPKNIRVFQVPHHGARNGTFDSAGTTPWMTHFQSQMTPVLAVMSSHIRPHKHPHPDVIAALTTSAKPMTHFRTDQHFHVRLETDGNDVSVRYSHE